MSFTALAAAAAAAAVPMDVDGAAARADTTKMDNRGRVCGYSIVLCAAPETAPGAAVQALTEAANAALRAAAKKVANVVKSCCIVMDLQLPPGQLRMEVQFTARAAMQTHIQKVCSILQGSAVLRCLPGRQSQGSVQCMSSASDFSDSTSPLAVPAVAAAAVPGVAAAATAALPATVLPQHKWSGYLMNIVYKRAPGMAAPNAQLFRRRVQAAVAGLPAVKQAAVLHLDTDSVTQTPPLGYYFLAYMETTGKPTVKEYNAVRESLHTAMPPLCAVRCRGQQVRIGLSLTEATHSIADGAVNQDVLQWPAEAVLDTSVPPCVWWCSTGHGRSPYSIITPALTDWFLQQSTFQVVQDVVDYRAHADRLQRLQAYIQATDARGHDCLLEMCQRMIAEATGVPRAVTLQLQAQNQALQEEHAAMQAALEQNMIRNEELRQQLVAAQAQGKRDIAEAEQALEQTERRLEEVRARCREAQCVLELAQQIALSS